MMDTSENATARGGYLAYLARVYALLDAKQEARRFATETLTSSGEPASLTLAAVVLANVGDSTGVERVLKLRSATTQVALSAANEHLIRGLLAAAKGDILTGTEEIRLAHDFNPRDEETTYWLGMTYLRAGDYRSALKMFENVRDLRGTVLLDDVPLLLPLTAYRIAECYERLGDPSAAAPYYAEVAKTWVAADEAVKPKGFAFHSNAK
jgi:TolA-binding protein